MYDIKKKNKSGKKNYEKSKKDEIKELDRENEDGITILFYLQKIYPGMVWSRDSFLQPTLDIGRVIFVNCPRVMFFCLLTIIVC